VQMVGPREDVLAKIRSEITVPAGVRPQ
jgi:hypothetical protein